MSILTLKTNDFAEVVAKHELIVIDFWAQWCQPCKSFSKVIEGVAPKYPEVTFAAVDIEKEKQLAEDFNIISVPAVMILKNQVVVYADSGAMPASALEELIEQAKAVDVSDA